MCREPWCIDTKAATLADGINYNFDGSTYQEKLNKLSVEEGVNFEMLGRSFNTITDMYKSKFYNFDVCLNVKMEDLFSDFDSTTQRILDFLSIDKNIDYSILSLHNNSLHKNHSTNKSLENKRFLNIFTEKNYSFFNQVFAHCEFNKYDYPIFF
jgi:hypothetical protein